MNWRKWFHKVEGHTIRIHAAALRHPTRSAAEIRLFLDRLIPLVKAGKITNEEFEQEQKAFYGENPTLIFVGYLAMKDKQLRLIDLETGTWGELPAAGDLVWRIEDFERERKNGRIQNANAAPPR